jgi:hypothetical protein
MRDETYTPGGRAVVNVPVLMRVLHRFTKPGGHVVEIKERRITSFEALEWMEFVDGNLIESRMYHGERLAAYNAELLERLELLRSTGWVPADGRPEEKGADG